MIQLPSGSNPLELSDPGAWGGDGPVVLPSWGGLTATFGEPIVGRFPGSSEQPDNNGEENSVILEKTRSIQRLPACLREHD